MNSPFGWRGWLRKLLNPKVEANIDRILAKVANAEVLFVHRFSMGGCHGFPIHVYGLTDLVCRMMQR